MVSLGGLRSPKHKEHADGVNNNGGPLDGSATADVKVENGAHDESHVPFLTMRTFFMAVLVSMGGLVFGYDTGQVRNIEICFRT